jgi:hypothetical protein
MSGVKLLLLGVLGACALSAAASTPAFAGSCTGSTNWVFCNGSGTELASGTLLLGLGGLALLAISMELEEIRFDCLDTRLHGTLQTLGMLTGSLAFLGCSVIKPTNCRLLAADEKEIKATFLGQLTGGLSAALTGAGPEGLFTTFHIVDNGGCKFISTYKITGSQLVEIPTGDISLANQQIVTKKASSHLFWNALHFSYSNTSTAMLASGETWLDMFGV